MIRKIFLFSIFLFLLFLPATVNAASIPLQQQLDGLKMQIEEMSAYYEARIASLETRVAELEKETGHEKHSFMPAEHKHKHDQPQHEHKHHHGLLGDKVKVIGALDGRYVNIEKQKNVLMLHEAKIGAQAEITDWLFAYATFTKHHGDDVKVEEAYAILKSNELGLSAKPGKFFVNFGPENLAHFFDRRTITQSAMHQGLFGSESWDDVGVQLDWLLPLGFYSDLSFSVLNGDNAATFGDGMNIVSNNNLPITTSLTNAFDTDYGYIKFGNSFAYGQWDVNDKNNVYLAGGNAYYKQGNFDAQAELIYRWKDLPDVNENSAYGYYVLGAYKIPLEFKCLKSVELLCSFGQFMPDTGSRETRFTPQVTLNLSPFAKIRVTYEVRDEYPKDTKNNRFISQFALAF